MRRPWRTSPEGSPVLVVGRYARGIIWTIAHYASGNKEASAPPPAAFDIGPAQVGRGAVASTTIRW